MKSAGLLTWQILLLYPLLLLLLGLLHVHSQPGFISLDCGGTENFTDTLGIDWQPDTGYISGGFPASIQTSYLGQQYQTLRYFNQSNRKYCYTLPVSPGNRNLIRATFLYGNFDESITFPQFSISIGATPWSVIRILNSSEVQFQEIIVSSQNQSSISVCIISGVAGIPFISTLELRQLQGSSYATTFDAMAYLVYSARINFGASDANIVRYPDDPVDRLWESDLAKKGSVLTNESPGTERVNTTETVTNSLTQEKPPSKVMQTAVVGSTGNITYRLKLLGFPTNAWAQAYLADITPPLSSNETREFTLVLESQTTKYTGEPVNLVSNWGPYTAYDPGFPNITLPELTNFAFQKTDNSVLGPILNALEILQIVLILQGTFPDDAAVVVSFKEKSSVGNWALEATGDPCLPLSWEWLKCTSDLRPRITDILLSSKNLTGSIPSALSQVTRLENLWLDGNQLNGSIPDLSKLVNLTTLHLQDNQLSGSFPEYFAELPNLKELFVQNNLLSGVIPPSLLANSDLNFQYSGNPGLTAEGSDNTPWKLIVGVVVGGFFLITAAFIAICILVKLKAKKSTKDNLPECKSTLKDPQSQSPTLFYDNESKTKDNIGAPVDDPVRNFSLKCLDEATQHFGKKVGQGGFGSVYYGKLGDGTEIAVKVLSLTSNQGTREFLNEVNLLSRIHHRNLVQFFGFCQEGNDRMLVYEFMHNGTLHDLIHGPSAKDRQLPWGIRLEMALDAAKGLEYLHTGCTPSIIHRDVKSSNILIDDKMKAKVSDFGLSKGVVEGATHVSSTVRGTLGYLDPEYYISQQLTEKSDVYSFGVVLLEVVSGKGPISVQHFGIESNIISWVRSHIQRGDISNIIDPALEGKYPESAAWEVVEIALQSVDTNSKRRPTMSIIVETLKKALGYDNSNKTFGSNDGPQTSFSPTYEEDFSASFVYSDSSLLPSIR